MHTPNQPAYKWVILIVVSIFAFFMFATVFTLPPILEIVKADLNLTYTDTGFLLAIPHLLIVILAIPGGLLADRIGFKKTAGIGSILIGLGGILRGFSTGFVLLFVFTILFGAGLGICYPNLPKIIGAWFPKKQVGTATGIYLVFLSLGPTVAMSFALPLFLPLTGSWRGTFYFWGVGALIVAAFWWFLMRGAPHRADDQSLTESGDTKIQGSPVKSRHLWMICLILLFCNVTFYVSTNWLASFYGVMGVEREAANLIASSVILGSIPAVFFYPVVSDRTGLRRPFLWVPMAAGAAISISLLFTSLEYGWILAPLLGFAIVGPFSLVFVLPIELFHHRQVGVATGMILAVGYVGSFTGSWVVGYLRDVTGSFASIPYLLFIAFIVTVVLSFTIPETGWKSRSRRMEGHLKEEL